MPSPANITKTEYRDGTQELTTEIENIDQKIKFHVIVPPLTDLAP